MNSVEAGLLADILENPHDDTPRLVYADWLEDHGKPAAGRFIARQIVGKEPAMVPLSWIGDAARGIFHVARKNTFRNEGRPGEATLRNGGVRIEWRRGFIRAVRCPLAAWEQHGPALVARHPVERVEVTDAVLTLVDYVEQTPDETHLCRWYRGARPKPPGLVQGASHLSPDIFDRLTLGSFNPDQRPRPWMRWYATADIARDDLSAACVAWAVAEARRQGLMPDQTGG